MIKIKIHEIWIIKYETRITEKQNKENIQQKTRRGKIRERNERFKKDSKLSRIYMK